ncbi:hypothetical protein [Streptomyces mirabilis]
MQEEPEDLGSAVGERLGGDEHLVVDVVALAQTPPAGREVGQLDRARAAAGGHADDGLGDVLVADADRVPGVHQGGGDSGGNLGDRDLGGQVGHDLQGRGGRLRGEPDAAAVIRSIGCR